MLYYRVKPRYDNTILSDSTLIGEELITKNEMDSMHIHKDLRKLLFDVVDEKPKNTFWFFGARFSDSFQYETND